MKEWGDEVTLTLGKRLEALLKELDTFHMPFNSGTLPRECGFTIAWEGEVIEVIARRKKQS